MSACSACVRGWRTCVAASTFAPLSSSSRTISTWPYFDARMEAVNPSCVAKEIGECWGGRGRRAPNHDHQPASCESKAHTSSSPASIPAPGPLPPPQVPIPGRKQNPSPLQPSSWSPSRLKSLFRSKLQRTKQQQYRTLLHFVS